MNTHNSTMDTLPLKVTTLASSVHLPTSLPPAIHTSYF